jgi:hypothetical protein
VCKYNVDQNCLTALLFPLGDMLHIKTSCVMMCTDLVTAAEVVFIESLCLKFTLESLKDVVFV